MLWQYVDVSHWSVCVYLYHVGHRASCKMCWDQGQSTRCVEGLNGINGASAWWVQYFTLEAVTLTLTPTMAVQNDRTGAVGV